MKGNQEKSVHDLGEYNCESKDIAVCRNILETEVINESLCGINVAWFNSDVCCKIAIFPCFNLYSEETYFIDRGKRLLELAFLCENILMDFFLS